MEVVFPDGLAQQLNINEYYKFYFEPRPLMEENSLVLNYNSSLLEQLGVSLKEKTIFSQTAVSSLYLKKARLEELFKKRLNFINSTYKIIEIKPSTCSYLILNYKYTAVSEERKDGLTSVAINEHNLFLVNNLYDEFEALFIDETNAALEVETLLPPSPLKVVFSMVSMAIEKILKEELADFQKSLNYRLEKDIKRLSDYFNAIIKEIDKKIAKKKTNNENFDKELSRLDFTEKELERKIIDQKTRYQINVNFKPFSALRVIIPVVALKTLLRCKKKSREINFVWNPIIKDLENPCCKKCFSPVANLFLDEESLDILCPACRG
ncbi:hypothetical protein HZB07_07280 [Candidatus Saganbacteria bacterium]|nr:hypothetical protein [Candidatus Saganbacteria bacterium]